VAAYTSPKLGKLPVGNLTALDFRRLPIFMNKQKRAACSFRT
jgi:hypothetical protein